jgi:hypothetical protein
MIQLMKNYVAARGSYLDRLLTDEARVPRRPEIAYTGDAAHPIDGLAFQSAAFRSPVGARFGAIQWRIAEVTDPDLPGFDPSRARRYEIEAAWQSGPLGDAGLDVAIPPANLEPGRLYRVRARMKDDAGRWSHWSEPIQFTAGPPEAPLSQYLRVSEINYHPHEAEPGELAADDNEFEFLELINTHTTHSLHLAGVQFTEGIQFDFTGSQVTELPPGGRAVLVKNSEAFESRYGNSALVAGEYSGALSNDGETLRLIDSLGAAIQEFAYNDSGEWPASADGQGHTLVAQNTSGDYNAPSNWRASSARGGTPGAAEPVAALEGDYNASGMVEQADLDLVLQYWGQEGASAPPAWTNGRPSGVIGQTHLDAVLLNWGTTQGALATARVAAPVPAALAAVDRPTDFGSSGNSIHDRRLLLRSFEHEQTERIAARLLLQSISHDSAASSPARARPTAR